MSGLDLTPPPPPPPPPPLPPPPPPPRPAGGSGYDFVQPFGFVFQDPRWVTKILIGGLFQILAMLLIGLPFLFGYCARLARNVIAGDPQPLPEWDDLGSYFAEGLRLLAVAVVYVVPFFAIVAAFVIPMGILGGIHHPNELSEQLANTMAGGAMSCIWCLTLPLGLFFSFWMPAAFLFAAIEQRFGAAFELGRIYAFIRGNLGNYLLAFVVALIARFAASLGFILFCIGIVLTAFWSLIVSTYAFAYAYRLARK